jgi:hypothetical protein
LRPDIRRTDGVTQGVDDLFVPEIETFNLPTVQYNTIKKDGDTGHDLEESDAPLLALRLQRCPTVIHTHCNLAQFEQLSCHNVSKSLS